MGRPCASVSTRVCTAMAAASVRSASVLTACTTSTSVARPVRSRSIECTNTRRRNRRIAVASATGLPVSMQSSRAASAPVQSNDVSSAATISSRSAGDTAKTRSA